MRNLDKKIEEIVHPAGLIWDNPFYLQKIVDGIKDLLQARDKEIVRDILPRVHALRAMIPLTGGMPARDEARELIKHLDNLLKEKE